MDTKKFSQFISQSTPFLQNSLKAMLIKLEDDKENIKLNKLTGNLYRQLGNHKKAITYFKKCYKLNESDRDAYTLYKILEQADQVSQDKSTDRICPFFIYDDFLNDDELSLIWDSIYDNENSLQESEIGDENSVNSQIRQSNVVYDDKLAEISNWFLSKVKDEVNKSYRKLQLNAFEFSKIELQLTVHRNKEYYHIHRDNDGHKLRSREITFVFYIHKKPKGFSGGHLLLYDTNTNKNICKSKYTGIVPDNNRLVLFPSSFYHQVTEVKSKSDLIDDCRITLNGWINK